MSINTDNTKETIQSILGFILAEPSYINITNQFGIDLKDLMHASKSIYANCLTLGQDLSAVFSSWNTLKSTDSDKAGEEIMRQLAVQIDAAMEELKSLKKSSASLYVLANAILSKLSSASATLHSGYNDEQAKIALCTKNINTIVAEIDRLNKKLSGSDGFWEGFKTGISFGIYTGLRDKLRAQKKLRETYTTQLMELRSSSGVLHADILAIDQINKVIIGFRSLDSCIVDMENSMMALSVLISNTEHDSDKLVQASGVSVSEFYKNRFNRDITALLQWKDVLPS